MGKGIWSRFENACNVQEYAPAPRAAPATMSDPTPRRAGWPSPGLSAIDTRRYRTRPVPQRCRQAGAIRVLFHQLHGTCRHGPRRALFLNCADRSRIPDTPVDPDLNDGAGCNGARTWSRRSSHSSRPGTAGSCNTVKSRWATGTCCRWTGSTGPAPIGESQGARQESSPICRNSHFSDEIEAIASGLCRRMITAAPSGDSARLSPGRSRWTAAARFPVSFRAHPPAPAGSGGECTRK